MPRLLITFGCSWTFGVGAGYIPGMDESTYKKIAWNDYIANRYTFRGLLSKKYDLINKNFASPGSSNQKQFRLAKLFFNTTKLDQLHKEFDQIFVMWGITSTARNELFLIEENTLTNFSYNDKSRLAKSLVKLSYDHNYEVSSLATEMLHWNTFFAGNNIKNIWFDTFNHHNYNNIEYYKKQYDGSYVDKSEFLTHAGPEINNLLFKNNNNRDLLSQLAINHGMIIPNNDFHRSDMEIDSVRVTHLIDRNILDPYTYHPTRLGHAELADILSNGIEQLITI
jgi:hypothetical protein